MESKRNSQIVNPTEWGYLVICPACTREHFLERKSVDRLILDGNELDEFQIDGGMVWPQFICRNTSCVADARTLHLDKW